jgi:hypothetical protein
MLSEEVTNCDIHHVLIGSQNGRQGVHVVHRASVEQVKKKLVLTSEHIYAITPHSKTAVDGQHIKAKV